MHGPKRTVFPGQGRAGDANRGQNQGGGGGGEVSINSWQFAQGVHRGRDDYKGEEELKEAGKQARTSPQAKKAQVQAASAGKADPSGEEEGSQGRGIPEA